MNRGTLLVVDDDLATLKLIAETLGAEGYHVLPADSGELALAALAGAKPALILLDLHMPGMDGFEVLRRLKAQDAWRAIPVIVLSGATELENRIEGFKLGAVDFVVKPFKRQELLARVAAHVELFRLQSALQQQAAELRALNDELQALRERERAQAELDRQSLERRFVDIVNTTDGIVWEADANSFEFTFVSHKAERLLGFPARDWRQPGFWVEHLHPDDKSWAPAYCASCTERLQPHDFEYRFIARDGRTVWLRDIVTVVPDADGRPRWLRGVMVDITAEKALREELQAAYRLVDQVQRLSGLGGWRYDCASRRIRWTDEVYRIHGVGHEHDPNDLERNLAFYEPEDRPTITQAFMRAVERGEAYALELRLRRPDGTVVWVRTMGEPQIEDGRMVSVTGNILDITERKAAEATIRTLAFHDELTGLPNRRLLIDRLQMACVAATRSAQHGAVLFIDLDRFKAVNDRFGHRIGDELLKAVAQRLSRCVRAADTVARLGGDEFVVMLELLEAGREQAQTQVTQIGQKILDALGEAYLLDGHECRCAPSIGAVLFNGVDLSVDELLRCADAAMYEVKSSGRPALRFHELKAD